MSFELKTICLYIIHHSKRNDGMSASQIKDCSCGVCGSDSELLSGEESC